MYLKEVDAPPFLYVQAHCSLQEAPSSLIPNPWKKPSDLLQSHAANTCWKINVPKVRGIFKTRYHIWQYSDHDQLFALSIS